MRMFTACVVLLLVFMKTVSSEADLQQHDYLDPINDPEQEHPSKEQDKRTIFSNHHGWAKHVGVHPSGFKYVIGYGPVNLKYVPVVKPITHYHHRPKLHLKRPLVLRPLLPVRPVIHQDTWKPVVPIVKPVVPIVKPVVPVNVPAPPHLPHKQWQQEGWTSAKPVVSVAKPVVPVVPVKPVVVPVKPVHHVPVVPAKPVHHLPVVPVKPVHHVPKPVVPLVPIPPALKPLPLPGIFAQYAPGTFVEYHGTHNFVPVVPAHGHVHPHVHVQPDVPVHPHVHIQPHVHVEPEVPHVHVQPQFPVHPHVHLQPQLPVQPHVHLQHQLPVRPHIHLQPQLPVEPHVHLQPQLPVQPHVHVDPHVHLPIQPHVHPVNPQVPPHEQHDVQTPLIPQNHPIFHQQVPVHNPEIFHQHPQEAPVNQPLPQTPPVLFHQQLPGNVQHLFNQQIQHGDGASSSILLQGSTIQPGHTDLQLPVHLPQHPNYLPGDGRQFQPGNFHDPSQHPESVFRPSAALEPPFTRK